MRQAQTSGSEIADEGIPPGALVWRMDPIEFALRASKSHRRLPVHTVPPTPPVAAKPVANGMCLEVGRRLLLAQFTFSDWVLRRVEKVSFTSDRRLLRSSTIELKVPASSPVIVRDDGVPCWLIPLSVMRRRTLVNLDLRDEGDRSISLMGLRFTQELDEAMLMAAGSLAALEVGDRAEVLAQTRVFVAGVISGHWREVQRAYNTYQAARQDPDHDLHELFHEPTFVATLERLWHNFTLYVALPVSSGRHRLLRLAFEERLVWRRQRPRLTPYQDAQDGRTATRRYEPMEDFEPRHRSWREVLGLKPTRIRFLTPSAENCASYHFEFTAPTGLSISSASLVAGRPNEDRELAARSKVSWDSVENPGQSVGLHAVEIPNGSLCRAQVDLRIPSRGWLGTLAASCWAITIVMTTVLWHSFMIDTGGEQWGQNQITNIVVLLVSVCAGAATYVAQHHATDVVARMATGLRALGLIALCIPAATACAIVYLQAPLHGFKEVLFLGAMGLVWLVSFGAALTITTAWWLIYQDEQRVGRPSPWDMTRVRDDLTDGSGSGPSDIDNRAGPDDDPQKTPLSLDGESFEACVEGLGFNTAAVGVFSAEGWHERYGWSEDRQRDAVSTLEGDSSRVANPTSCTCGRVDGHTLVPAAE
jgi:hypothetical protein